MKEKHYPISKVSRNLIFLKHFISNPNITVGDYTYYDGRDSAESFEKENVVLGLTSKLTIGKFCQLAYDTTFILSDANHQMSGFSTYPFFVFGNWSEGCEKWKEYPLDLPANKETVIGNDVWFGHKSTLMPGVCVGDGAIIAARSVVTKDVPPYTIVGGNPAKIIRQRFSDGVVEKLQHIAWWDWDFDKISRHIKAIAGADIHALLSCE